MNIFGHLIPEKYILGIGAIMQERHHDKTYAEAYGATRYYFQLHLPAHTTIIQSDWFEANADSHEKEAAAIWRQQYFDIREKVAVLIGEDTQARKIHLEKVEATYASLKNNLELVIQELEAGPTLNNPINARIERIFLDLAELRELAAK